MSRRSWIRWTARAAAVLAFALALGSADAAPIDDAIAGLHAALQARAAAAGTPRLEKTKLLAADKALAHVNGDFDVADLNGLYGTGKNLVASKTADAGVISAGFALSNALIDEAEVREDEIVVILANVLIPRTKAVVQATIDKARVYVANAQTEEAAHPGSAIVALRTALVKYDKIKARVTAIVASQIPSSLLTQEAAGGFLANHTQFPITITGVFLDVQVTPTTSAPFHLARDITSELSGSAEPLPYVVAPHLFYNLADPISVAIPAAFGSAETYRFAGTIQLTLKGRPTQYFLVSN